MRMEEDGDAVADAQMEALGQSLVSACRLGDSSEARGLLVKGANVNFTEDDRRAWTPLMWASCRGNLDVVEMLIKDFGAAEPYVGSTRSQSVPPGRHSRAGAMTPVAVAARPGTAPEPLPRPEEDGDEGAGGEEGVTTRDDVAKGMDGEDNDASAPGEEQDLLAAADADSRRPSTQNGSTSRMGMTMYATEGEGVNSPLHWAALKGNLGVVQALLRSGLDVHDVDDVGNSALHLACAGGHPEVAKYLLNNGADAHLRNSFGNTPAKVANGAAMAALIEGVGDALVYRGDVSLYDDPRDVLSEDRVWNAIKWRHWKADKTATALCMGPWCSSGPRRLVGDLLEPVLASIPGAGIMWERQSCVQRVVLTPSTHHKGDILIPTMFCAVCEGRMVEAERLLQLSIDVEDDKVLDDLAIAINHAEAMQADLALVRRGRAMETRLKCERHMKACCVETDACRPPQGRDEIDRLIDSIEQTKAHSGNRTLVDRAEVLLYVTEVELDLKEHCDAVRALPLAHDRTYVVACKDLIAKGEDCEANPALLQDLRDLVVRMECEIELVEATLQPVVMQTLADGSEVEIIIPECTYEWTLKGWKAGGAWEPLPPPPVEGKKPKKAKPKKRKPPPPLYTYYHVEGGVARAVQFRSDGPGGTLDSLEYRDKRLTAAQEAGLASVVPVNAMALSRAGEEQFLMCIPRESDGRAGNMGVAQEEDTEKKRKEAILEAKAEKKRLKAEAKAAKKEAKAEKKRLKDEAKAAKAAEKAEKKRLKDEAKAAKAAEKAEAKAAKQAELAAKAAAKAAGAAAEAAPAAAAEAGA